LVEVRVGDETLQSGIRRTTLTPKWNWPFALNHYKSDSQISFFVRDADGGGSLGQYPLTVGKLMELARPDYHFPAAGSVEILQIKVEPLPDIPEHRVFHFKVPANESLIDLASRQGPRLENSWQPIPVLNGDAIRIVATGMVTFSAGFPRSLYEHTVSPEGRTSVERGSGSHPLEQCEKMNDHALVAFLAGKPIFIGASKYENPSVEQSGQFLLGVNDIDVGNNSGSFDVTVDVNPPDLIKQRHPSPAYQPPSWGR